MKAKRKSERQRKAGSMEEESSQRSLSAKHVIQATKERENNIPRIKPLKQCGYSTVVHSKKAPNQ
jgi:hypothetical protein